MPLVRDVDSQSHFVGTNLKNGDKTWPERLIPDSRVLINEGTGREANKLNKIN